MKNLEEVSDIIHGLFYLSRCALESGMPDISNLIEGIIEDISGLASNQTENKDLKHQLINKGGFIEAISFLAKYASLKDEVIKTEIIEYIEKYETKQKKDNIIQFLYKV